MIGGPHHARRSRRRRGGAHGVGAAGLRRVLAAALLALPFPAATAEGETSIRFVDVTAASGIEVRNVCGPVSKEKGWPWESLGAAAAWLDYDGDGKLDLYVVNGAQRIAPAEGGVPLGPTNRLYRGDGTGRFEDVTARSGAGDRGWGVSVAVGDYDGDGDPDLYLANLGPNVLYRNDGDGTFVDVTVAAGVGGEGASTAAVFFDMDGDDDLDLYVAGYARIDSSGVPRRGSPAAAVAGCEYHGIPVLCGPETMTAVPDALYRNAGDGTFTEVGGPAGLRLDAPRVALGAIATDFDADGDEDVYVVNDGAPNLLWRNRGNGTFEEAGFATLSAVDGRGRVQRAAGAAFGDVDGDGFEDLVLATFVDEPLGLYRNVGGRFFLDVTSVVGLARTRTFAAWSAGLHDLDLDGDLDLFVTAGGAWPWLDDHDAGAAYREPNRVFDNVGGRLVDVSERAGPALGLRRSFRFAAFGDYDGDGDLDVFVTALDEPPVLLRNER